MSSWSATDSLSAKITAITATSAFLATEARGLDQARVIFFAPLRHPAPPGIRRQKQRSHRECQQKRLLPPRQFRIGIRTQHEPRQAAQNMHAEHLDRGLPLPRQWPEDPELRKPTSVPHQQNRNRREVDHPNRSQVPLIDQPAVYIGVHPLVDRTISEDQEHNRS